MENAGVKPSKYRPNVGLMVLNATGDVFVGQRIDRPDTTGAWQMPQGGIDAGEDPETTAFRELAEETGIAREHVSVIAQSKDWLHYDFPPELAVKLWRGGYAGQKQRWFLMRFHGRDEQINIQTEEPEFDAWKWLPPSELVENIVEWKRHIYEKVLAEFDDHLR